MTTDNTLDLEKEDVSFIGTATANVTKERIRGIKKGWGSVNDDSTPLGDHAAAGAAYAIAASQQRAEKDLPVAAQNHLFEAIKGDPVHCWPWANSFWNPSPDAFKNLTKAAAFIHAEMTRVLRERSASGVEVSAIRPGTYVCIDGLTDQQYHTLITAFVLAGAPIDRIDPGYLFALRLESCYRYVGWAFGGEETESGPGGLIDLAETPDYFWPFAHEMTFEEVLMTEIPILLTKMYSPAP